MVTNTGWSERYPRLEHFFHPPEFFIHLRAKINGILRGRTKSNSQEENRSVNESAWWTTERTSPLHLTSEETFGQFLTAVKNEYPRYLKATDNPSQMEFWERIRELIALQTKDFTNKERERKVQDLVAGLFSEHNLKSD